MIGLNLGHVKKPDLRSYKNFKHWDTARLKAVIDEPYNRGFDGADYAPYIDEITDVYFTRLSKIAEKNINNEISRRNK